MFKNQKYRFQTKKSKDEVLQIWGTLPLSERKVLRLFPRQKDQANQLYFKQGNTLNYALGGMAEWMEDGHVVIQYHISKFVRLLLLLSLPFWVGLPVLKAGSNVLPPQLEWTHVFIFIGMSILVFFGNLFVYYSRMKQLNAKWTSLLNARPEELN